MKTRHHSIAGVFVFLLLGLFAVFGTVLVLLCSQAYRGTVARTTQHNDARILESIVRHAVRAEDAQGCVHVAEYDGVTVLCVADDPEPDSFVTYLYAFDGALCEQYADPADGFVPERGEILAGGVTAFDARIDGQRLDVTMTDAQGEAYASCIVLYASGVTP